MLDINILEDETLQDTVNKFISALLPHENYKREYFTEVYTTLVEYINVNEFSGEYYVLMDIINKVKQITSAKASYPYIDKTVVTNTMRSNFNNLVYSKYVDISTLLRLEEADTNLDNPESFSNAIRILTNRTLELYDRCFELKQSSDEVINYIPALKNNLCTNVMENIIQQSARIMVDGVTFRGQKIIGPMSAMRRAKRMSIELENRLSELDDKTIRIDNRDKSDKLYQEANQAYQVLAKYGIPPLDDETPILRHRFVVVQANEGVGKTKFAIDCAVNIILAGGKVLFMVGETTQGSMHIKILTNYIKKKYNIFVKEKHIIDARVNPDSITNKDVLKKIRLAQDFLDNSGCIHYRNSYRFETLYEELVADYEIYKFDGLFIDHSDQLKGNLPLYERISLLARHVKNFRKDYPVYVQVLSHMSGSGKILLEKDKQITSSGTKGSSDLSNDADEVFTLSKTPLLDKQGLRHMFITKRRGTPVPDTLVLRTLFGVNSFEWDDKVQTSDSKKIGKEQALEKISQVYNANEFGEDDDDDDDYSL